MSNVYKSEVAKQHGASEKTMERALAGLGIAPTIEAKVGKRTFVAYDKATVDQRSADIAKAVSDIRAAGTVARAKYFAKGHPPLVRKPKGATPAIPEISPNAISALGEIQVIRKHLNKLAAKLGG